ncbi:MAG: [FeFe] hydrogenase H-cluster maturation GTPase HydF [Firmicutes bacterium]|jgi:[FeFe] hydrogenase H-cluster maturation GTPase HydF|nr:[FeFe] hydrogenase H-cluster maturation GTPase HydF [Bacillota bacterium]
MQQTPRSQRLQIALVGRRNSGKSSLLNALTGQDVALVSEIAGTTTDPVYKAAEFPPLGPIVWVDTAGLDDEGELGRQRVERTWDVIRRSDMVILVVDASLGGLEKDSWLRELLDRLLADEMPCLVAETKADLADEGVVEKTLPGGVRQVRVSALTKAGLDALKEAIVRTAPVSAHPETIVGDLVAPGDTIILVVHLDAQAPKGRLILPQVQVLRDLLDHQVQALVVPVGQLGQALAALKDSPRLVITDSQVFDRVGEIVPDDVPLTSFSILFARYNGDLRTLVNGVDVVDRLRPGDPVLIAEACTHRPMTEDIGRVKIPRLLTRYIGGAPEFTWCNGNDFPADLERYRLVIHCGGCMIQAKEMRRRLKVLAAGGVPVVNYGVLLSYLHGVLDRALSPFDLSPRREYSPVHESVEMGCQDCMNSTLKQP